ncbi:MAG: UDP-3-O-acyl-N-acetylglucosamine deacetylase [Nitrospirota bacterium]
MRLQRTIRGERSFTGWGLHSGRRARMLLRPAPRDTGVVFHRRDKGGFVPAQVAMVSDTAFATTLRVNGSRVRTVEHLLSAAAGLGVDNMVVELEGPEVPIMDGSARAFAEGILAAGVAPQGVYRSYIKVIEPVSFRDGHAEIVALPYEGRAVTCHVSYGHPLVGEQRMCVDLEDEESFVREIAPARTFGFLKDVQRLKSMGLAQGGSLDNAVLLSDTGVINASGLRFKDECVRHKILDFVGDLSLAGLPIEAHFIVSRSGHAANTKFLRHLLSDPGCWQIVSGAEHGLRVPA